MSKLRLGLVFVAATAAFALIVVRFVRRDAAVAPASVVAPTATTAERQLESVSTPDERGQATSVQLAEGEVPSGQGLLRLTVIAHDSGVPVADSPWRVVRANETSEADLAASITEFGGYTARTDAHGHAEFTLPAGVEWKLLSGPPDAVEQLVPALGEREARELTLRVGPTADDWFVARVIDADTQRPIDGAQFSPLSRFAASLDKLEVGATSDARGDVRIDLRNWSPFDALVCAKGYAMRAIPTEVDRTRPFVEVELERVGPLHVRVDGAKSLRKEIEVEIAFARGALFAGVVNGKPGQRMRAKLALDEELQTFLASPPLRTGIDVAARIRPNPPGRKNVKLAPGEERTVVFDLSRKVAVFGRVVDSDKRAVAGAELLLQRTAPLTTESEASKSALPEIVEPAPEPRTTLTDADGMFRFEEVPPGHWSLGTDPERLAQLAQATTPGVAKVEPRRLRLLGDGTDAELELNAIVGWMIAGRVVDPDGRPVEGASVGNSEAGHHARRSGDGRTISTDVDSATSGPSGEFTLGPVTLASIEIVATTEADGLSESSAVELNGPASHVVLALTRSCRIAGRVTPVPSDEDERLEVYLTSNTSSHWNLESSWSEGPFEFEAVPPGEYRVVARSSGRSSDGLAVVSRPIQLAEGQQINDLLLELAPAARIRIVAGGSSASREEWELSRWYRVQVDGASVEQFVVTHVDEEGLVIPAGRVRITPAFAPSTARDGTTTPVAEFDLAPGETRVVTIGG
ncbi:MAG: carboxypeptidase-like regulatory domain-containing protein [Planctomycetes bacterium]|nr:carboxypeptidase-like regulatory domain-containing protein [Planctomycetota bacterium]